MKMFFKMRRQNDKLPTHSLCYFLLNLFHCLLNKVNIDGCYIHMHSYKSMWAQKGQNMIALCSYFLISRIPPKIIQKEQFHT